MHSFDAPTADAAWLLAAAALKERRLPKQSGRGGDTTELLHVGIQIHDPRQRWVISRTPALSVAFAIVEVIGILNGRRDSGYLIFFNPILPRFAGDGPKYHGAYGHRLRSHFGFDQLQRARDALATNPDGRQVVLQLWDCAIDFPSYDGKPVAEDIPCNVCSMLKVRNGKLEWSQIMRSNDLFKGLPYNFVQFTTLQEVIAGWIGVEPGIYTHYADSLHVYDQDAPSAFASARIPLPETNESLALPKEVADPIWLEMNRRVDVLIGGDHSPKEYGALAFIDDAPESFSNLMAVVVADAARRKRCFDGVHNAISQCHSALLRTLWERWEARKAGKCGPREVGRI